MQSGTFFCEQETVKVASSKIGIMTYFIVFLLFAYSVTFTEALNCYHCTSIAINSTFYRPDCNATKVPDAYLMECGQWPWPIQELLQIDDGNDVKANGNVILDDGMTLYNPSRIGSNGTVATPQGYTLDLICAKLDADMQNVHHVIRGCVFALLKDMVNKCENLDYDYETIDGVTLKNMKVCFCNQEACNSGNTLNPLWLIAVFLVTPLLVKSIRIL
ncbi:uncharacterized protein LOC110856339 isoform X1 [Folsomia candida]|uniref:uncharacterized protein LOC110856339 isoform X1 n=1 Tax=Folsomia candida TaxID=158441 RepID=UPI00160518AC|nr:uncharacterized protein LOC110856339 isoform X1 [Folsomia candida]XP_035712772.1 uncharacterized protein LOC110856339 isoform X1 [Folsomia candida]